MPELAAPGQDRKVVRKARALLLAPLGLGMLAIYLLIGRVHFWTPRLLHMPEGIPFAPAFCLPYLGLLLVAWSAPLHLSNPRRFKACVIASLTGFSLAVIGWLLFPTTLPRPPIPQGWITLPYRLMALIDAPTNVLPCAHVIPPVVVGWYLKQEHPGWGLGMGLVILLGAATISLTWQHRPIDILIGLAIAAIGIACGEAWRRHTAMHRR